MRLILNTGKGGVGKTTISALSAINMAKNYKTLLISSDYAHSLSDVFGMVLDNEPKKISKNLYALEINPIKESKKAWGNLHEYFKEIVNKNAVSDIQMDELLLLPGFDDVFSLLRILEEFDKNEFEIIVVDCGPSAETISLISMGEKMNNLSKSLVHIVKRFNSIFGSFIEKKTYVKKPKDIVFDEFKALSYKLYRLQKIFLNRDITSIRLVTKPNSVVMKESFKTYTLTNMYGILTDLVFINMVYPKTLSTSSLGDLVKVQEKNISEIEVFFKRQRIISLELFDREISGIGFLEKLSNEIFKDDLSQIFTSYISYEIREENGSKIIAIDLSYANENEIRVSRIDDDIEVTYLNYKRRIKLEDSLVNRNITSYALKDKKLMIVMDY